jgi:hypothetical protein
LQQPECGLKYPIALPCQGSTPESLKLLQLNQQKQQFRNSQKRANTFRETISGEKSRINQEGTTGQAAAASETLRHFSA